MAKTLEPAFHWEGPGIAVANHLDFPDTQASKTFEAIFEIMNKTPADGEDVLLSGFGKFCVKNKDQRKGRNPTTGNSILLDAKRVALFKCSSVFKGKLNG
jgi:integration host factor subunit alpha